MARDRARTDPLSAESRREVLRDGLRHVRAAEFIPYDPTPYALTNAELIKLMGAGVSHFGVTMRQLQVAIARAAGKNHAAEKFKEIQRGMVIFTQVTDEATRPNIDIKIPKRKEFKPKRQRIKDREPYYVKLTRPRKDIR